MSEIKWSYDAQTGSFSALPASPWLLPALGLICLAPIAEKMLEEAAKKPEPISDAFDPVAYQKNKQLYHELIHKQASSVGLTQHEEMQLLNVMRPPWATGGELWTY
jgi:hypothetical protein